MGWKYGYVADAMQTLTPVADPENSLFSFKTGMELVYMESTRYSNGLVYSVLQDAEESVVFTGSICRITVSYRRRSTRI